MRKTRIKICGMSKEKDIYFCSQAGVDALGFVTEYPVSVPWNLKRERARELVKKVPLFISSVMVTTGSVKEIIELTKFVKPNAVQLHGEESPKEVEEIVEFLHSKGMRAIKAIAEEPAVSRKKQEEKIIRFQETGIDAILIDAKSEERPGGTGKTVDWKRAARLFEKVRIPTILAGGLKPENVRKAIDLVNPAGVDVITGVEEEEGKKDYKKIEKFIRNASP